MPDEENEENGVVAVVVERARDPSRRAYDPYFHRVSEEHKNHEHIS